MCKIDLVPDVLNTSHDTASSPQPSPAQPAGATMAEFSFQICEDQKQYVQRTQQ